MKEATLQILITARALLEQAERHCGLGDRYLATAGLIVLQDAVELVLLAVLIEKDVDQDRAIEKLSFDDMMSSVGRLGIKVPKSGTLRAMNKLRVTAKHYGQIMEPFTVQGHLNASKRAIDEVLRAAVGKPLQQIFLTELVGQTASRTYLDEAASALESGKFASSVLATRKAFFIEFELPYCIYEYRNAAAKAPFPNGLLGLLRGGWKAPYWKRDPKWIRDNVKSPVEYVQIDYDNWRIDAMEWGISTQTLNNIRRLTPEAVQLEVGGPWHIRVPAAYAANSANRENASMCLDLTIEAIRRKYEFIRSARTAANDKSYETPDAYVGQPLLERPARDSRVLHVLAEGDSYLIHERLSGFDARQSFFGITCMPPSSAPVRGYVERIAELPLKEPVSDDDDSRPSDTSAIGKRER